MTNIYWVYQKMNITEQVFTKHQLWARAEMRNKDV